MNSPVISVFSDIKKKLATITNEESIEAKLIICHVMEWPSSKFIAQLNTPLDNPSINKIYHIVNERVQYRKPLALCFGTWEFFGNSYHIEPGVLIPRTDTECLVEKTSQIISEYQLTHGIEVGFGTGIISIELLRTHTNLRINAWDINPTALTVATKNKKQLLSAPEKLGLHVEDAFNIVPSKWLHSPNSFIVSNPPYIRSQDIKNLDPEVSKWDPVTALDGGNNGLIFYEKLITLFLHSNATHLMVEIGYDQQTDIEGMVETLNKKQALINPSKTPYVSCETFQDLNHHPRVCWLKKRQAPPNTCV